MIKIFSVIVTYNGLKWYDRCFGSLQNSSMPVSVVVVDNGSTDGTVDYIRCRYPEIVVLQQDENLGFAKANNVGMRYAMDHGADYVFLLNQDAWLVQPDVLERMVAISVSHPEYAVLSPLQLYGNGQRIVYETKYYASQNRNKEMDWISDSYFNRLRDVYDTQYVCAASWLLPIHTLKMIGGFDPLFFHYGEDDNYIQRVKYYGCKIGICSQVNVCHDIENRSSDYTEKNLDWKKYLLIRYCDINVEYDFSAILRSLWIKMLFQLLRLQRKHIKKSYSEYRFLKERRKEIEESRSRNRRK